MAKLNIRNGSTSNVIRFVLADSASTTGAGKTGITSASSGLIIGTIADNESAGVNYTSAGSTVEAVAAIGTFATPTATKCRLGEVSSTNHPGLYELHLDNTRYAVTSAKRLYVTVQCTGCVPVYLEIQQDSIPVDVRAIAGDTTAPTNLANAYNGTGYTDGTAQAGAAGSITLPAGFSAVNDFYKGFIIQPVGGTGGGQAGRLCTAYNGGTKVATVTPNWTTTPDNTTTFVLVTAVDYFRAIVGETVGSFTIQQMLSGIFAAVCGSNPTAGTYKTPDGTTTRLACTVQSTAPFRGAVTVSPSA